MQTKIDGFYSVLIETTKGRITLSMDRSEQDFVSHVLRHLKEFIKTGRPMNKASQHSTSRSQALMTARAGQPLTAIGPGLLHVQLGPWQTRFDAANVKPAIVTRGSVSVSNLVLGQAYNFLLARKAARNIERLYMQLGQIVSGMDIVDDLTEDDLLTEVYWSKHDPYREDL